MDIDVKNALDNVLQVCSAVDPVAEKNLEKLLAKDIEAFIHDISLNGGDERFDYFSKLYLNGKYKAADYSETSTGELPEVLKLFSSIDSNSLNKVGVKTSKILIAFFTLLGKSYLASPYDKKSINSSRFIEIIKGMDTFTANNTPNESCAKVVPDNNEDEIDQHKAAEQQSALESGETEQPVEEPEESLEELMDKLNDLIGLDGVKKEVNQIINLIKVRKKGEEFGEKMPPLSLHLVFYGNPGTGKTTVARLLAKIYKSLGVLSGGQLVEVDRSGLVAGYIGQTATKTKDVINKAMGGILFIDEAYALTHGKGETDFGQEAVDTILKAMEDHRDDFIVIVAGYPDLMKEFIASNPGLKSRFNQFINFADYTPEELHQIFCLYCKNQHLIIDDDCNDYLGTYFQSLYDNRKDDFANGRDVRNYFENALKARANRLAEGDMENMTREEYLTIALSDLEEAAETSKIL